MTRSQSQSPSQDRPLVESKIPTILIAGTWGDDAAWWKIGSPFWMEARRNGVSLQNGADPYTWTTEVDGLFGRNRDWETAGDALRWYCGAKKLDRVNILAHSHGGQPALYAAAKRLPIDTLITIATPIRWDMEEVAETARPFIRLWIHLRSDRSDWMQWLGEILDGRLAWPGTVRDFDVADQNIIEPSVGHSGLLEPGLWTERGWWKWLV